MAADRRAETASAADASAADPRRKHLREARSNLLESHVDTGVLSANRTMKQFMGSYSRPARTYLIGKLLSDIQAGCGGSDFPTPVQMVDRNRQGVEMFWPLMSLVKDGDMSILPNSVADRKAVMEHSLVQAIRESSGMQSRE